MIGSVEVEFVSMRSVEVALTGSGSVEVAFESKLFCTSSMIPSNENSSA